MLRLIQLDDSLPVHGPISKRMPSVLWHMVDGHYWNLHVVADGHFVVFAVCYDVVDATYLLVWCSAEISYANIRSRLMGSNMIGP